MGGNHQWSGPLPSLATAMEPDSVGERRTTGYVSFQFAIKILPKSFEG
jgi:hypothetical protein